MWNLLVAQSHKSSVLIETQRGKQISKQASKEKPTQSFSSDVSSLFWIFNWYQILLSHGYIRIFKRLLLTFTCTHPHTRFNTHTRTLTHTHTQTCMHARKKIHLRPRLRFQLWLRRCEDIIILSGAHPTTRAVSRNPRGADQRKGSDAYLGPLSKMADSVDFLLRTIFIQVVISPRLGNCERENFDRQHVFGCSIECRSLFLSSYSFTFLQY